MAKYCINCGQALPSDTATFCPNCGSPQPANAARPQRVIAQITEETYTCPKCGGVGTLKYRSSRFSCPVCFGTGKVSERKAEQHRKTINSQLLQAAVALIFVFAVCGVLYWLIFLHN